MTSSLVWRYQRPHSNDNRLQRLRNRPRNSLSSQRPPQGLSINMVGKRNSWCKHFEIKVGFVFVFNLWTMTDSVQLPDDDLYFAVMRMFWLLPDFRQFICIFWIFSYIKVHISGLLLNMHSHAWFWDNRWALLRESPVNSSGSFKKRTRSFMVQDFLLQRDATMLRYTLFICVLFCSLYSDIIRVYSRY